MEEEGKREIRLVAVSLGCAVLLLGIIMVVVAVAGTWNLSQATQQDAAE